MVVISVLEVAALAATHNETADIWQETNITAYYSNKLIIKTSSEKIKVTWEAVRNTDKMVVSNTNDITIYMPQNLTEEIHITAVSPETHLSTVKPEIPHTSIKPETHHSTVNSEIPNTTIKPELPNATVKPVTPHPSSSSSIKSFTILLIIAPFLVIFKLLTSAESMNKQRFLFTLTVVALAILHSALAVTDYSPTDVLSVHIKVPIDYIDKICVNNKKPCFPTTCNLGRHSKSAYSKIDAQNKILFSDKYCSIKKPDRWDEWIMHFYAMNGSSTPELYYMDTDNDGLANILEYYAANISQLFETNSGAASQLRRKIATNIFDSDFPSRNKRDDFDYDIDVGEGDDGQFSLLQQQQVPIENIGSNPHKADSDGDLLLDGFEFSNSMNPTKKGNPSQDTG